MHAIKLALLLLIFPVATEAEMHRANGHPKVVIIHSYLEQSLWRQNISKAFKVEFKRENLSAEIVEKTFYGEELLRKGVGFFRKEALAIANEVSRSNPDAVLLCDDEAVDGLMHEFVKRKIPTFFCGVNQDIERADWWQRSSRQFQTGVLERFPTSNALQVLKKIVPFTKKIALLTSDSKTSHIITSQIIEDIKTNRLESKFEIKIVAVEYAKNLRKWKYFLSELVKKSDILWIVIPYEVLDDEGHEVPPLTLGKFISEYKIPTMGVSTINLKMGQLISLSVTAEGIGKQAAQQIIRYLKGQSIYQIDVESSMYYNLEINASEARRLKMTIPTEFLGFAKFTESD